MTQRNLSLVCSLMEFGQIFFYNFPGYFCLPILLKQVCWLYTDLYSMEIILSRRKLIKKVVIKESVYYK